MYLPRDQIIPNFRGLGEGCIFLSQEKIVSQNFSTTFFLSFSSCAFQMLSFMIKQTKGCPACPSRKTNERIFVWQSRRDNLIKFYIFLMKEFFLWRSSRNNLRKSYTWTGQILFYFINPNSWIFIRIINSLLKISWWTINMFIYCDFYAMTVHGMVWMVWCVTQLHSILCPYFFPFLFNACYFFSLG